MPNAINYGVLGPTYKQVNDSGLIKSGVGQLRGIFCSSGTGVTLTLYDNTAGSGTILINTFPLTDATYYDMADVVFGVGLYAVKGTGSAELTFLYF
jgi:hypothetical protein